MSDLCACGCGASTSGFKYPGGRAVQYVAGHNSKGTSNPRWHGGRAHKGKYSGVRDLSQRDGYRYEHRAVVEAALGHPLPAGAEVHHLNGDRFDNRPRNLVVCPDTAYHRLLHLRTRAYRATGNPNARSCKYCGRFDTTENPDFAINSFSARRPLGIAYHRSCSRAR